MNAYTFDSLSVGMEERFEAAVTDEMMDAFLRITGDINPLHADAAFAAERGYRDRCAYGMLTASFLSTLAGVYLPGKNSLIHSVDVSFVKPVYVGDTLLVSGKVIEKSDVLVNRIVLKVEMRNQNSLKVLRGKMTIGVLE